MSSGESFDSAPRGLVVVGPTGLAFVPHALAPPSTISNEKASNFRAAVVIAVLVMERRLDGLRARCSGEPREPVDTRASV